MVIELKIDKQALIDELADLKAKYQHALRMKDRAVMQIIASDMQYCNGLLNDSDNN